MKTHKALCPQRVGLKVSTQGCQNQRRGEFWGRKPSWPPQATPPPTVGCTWFLPTAIIQSPRWKDLANFPRIPNASHHYWIISDEMNRDFPFQSWGHLPSSSFSIKAPLKKLHLNKTMAFSPPWQNSNYVLSEYSSKIRPYISQQAKQMGNKS